MVPVNIRGMMEFWTAGKLKPTWHRVNSNTVLNLEHGFTDRYSFTVFPAPQQGCGIDADRGFRSGCELEEQIRGKRKQLRKNTKDN